MPDDSLARSVVASGLSDSVALFLLPSPLSLSLSLYSPNIWAQKNLSLSLSLSLPERRKIEKIKSLLLFFYEIAIEKENPSTTPPSQDSSRRRFGGFIVSNRLSISPVSLNLVIRFIC